MLARGRAQATLVAQGALEERDEVVGGQRLEPQQERARQQGRDHRERRVLGCGRDQRDEPVLYRGEQHVLLRLGEAVHLIDEEDRRPTPGELAAGLLDLGAHLLDPGGDGGQLDETTLGGLRDDGGDGRLSHSWRPPEEHRHGLPVREPAQRRARSEQVLLPDDLVEAAGPQPHRKWGLWVAGVTQRAAPLWGLGIEVSEQVDRHPATLPAVAMLTRRGRSWCPRSRTATPLRRCAVRRRLPRGIRRGRRR